MLSNVELIGRLLLSVGVGGLIGIERESNNRPAGFRTHILVSLGATLLTLISTQGFILARGIADPARLSAQIVSGVGFLGAGTIYVVGTNIKGLTTASSLWVCGGLGLAVGGGYYLGALVVLILTFVSLRLLKKVEKGTLNKRYKIVVLQCSERAGLITDIAEVLKEKDIYIKNMLIHKHEVQYNHILINTSGETECQTIEFEFTLISNKNFDYKDLESMICKIEGVQRVKLGN